MAAIRQNAATKGFVRIVTETTKDGKQKTKDRLIPNINPAATDDDVQHFLTELGKFQSFTVVGVGRTDNSLLIEQAA